MAQMRMPICTLILLAALPAASETGLAELAASLSSKGAGAIPPAEWVWPPQAGMPDVRRKLIRWQAAAPADLRLTYRLTPKQGEEELLSAKDVDKRERAIREHFESLRAIEEANDRNRGVLILMKSGVELPPDLNLPMEAKAQPQKGLVTNHGTVTGESDCSDSGKLRHCRVYIGIDPKISGPSNHLYEVETYFEGRLVGREHSHSSPLVLDLDGAGVKTAAERVLFDLEGKGNPENVRWMNDIERGTGLLVFDADGDGLSGENGLELFGDNTDLDRDGEADGYPEGFRALRALAAKAAGQGLISAEAVGRGVLAAPELSLLESAYGLKIKLGGFNAPPVSLAQAGVAAIGLSDQPVTRAKNFDGRGNDLMLQEGAIFERRDGSLGHYMDLWLIPSGSARMEQPGFAQRSPGSNSWGRLDEEARFASAERPSTGPPGR